MEMATKYDIETTRQDIVDAMNFDWPGQLEQWEHRRKDQRCVEPAALVRFGNKYGLPNVRAIGLYELCQADARVQWLKIRHRRTGDIYFSEGAEWHPLTSEDYRDLLRIIQLQNSFAGTCIDTDEHCTDCETKKRYESMKLDILQRHDYLDTIRENVKAIKASTDCYICPQIQARHVESQRRMFWDKLLAIGRGEYDDHEN